MVEVQKVKSLSCPNCGSDEVSPGFTKRRGKAYLKDGKVYCYSCKHTITASGKVVPFSKQDWYKVEVWKKQDQVLKKSI